MRIIQTKSAFNLNLPYNVIYYFPSGYRELDDEMAKAVGRWKSSWKVRDIQQFDFLYKYVPEELMDTLGNLNPAGVDAAKEETYGELLLRRLLGRSDGGVLAVRPVPDRFATDTEDDVCELFVASEISPASTSAFFALDEFAVAVAKSNFERMTGRDYHQYRMRQDFKNDSIPYNGGPFLQVMTVGSRDFQLVSSYTPSAESIIKKKISKMGITCQTAQMEDIINWLQQMMEEAENSNKICQKAPLCIDYDDHKTFSYEVVVENGKSTPIRCEFIRGVVAKAFYIFLLRHPEGVAVKELMKHKRELNVIYNKLSGALLTQENECIDNLCNNNSDVIKVLRSDIKSTFKSFLATGIVSDYCVENQHQKLRIPLEDDYVDLKEFDFKINI
ncbi:MAG: hypothetical protein MJZ57_03880 [Bacteroidales bacterium]|nr:hypothetical protein [Bacteroidales bacterium]